MTLTVWPVPATACGKGPATEVYAVETSVDRLLVELASTRNVLSRSVGGTRTISGRLRAPSRDAAFETIAGIVGFEAHPPRFTGGGPAVSLDVHTRFA